LNPVASMSCRSAASCARWRRVRCFR